MVAPPDTDLGLGVWAIVMIASVVVPTIPALLAWQVGKRINKAVNDVDDGELQISRRVRDMHESLEVRMRMLSDLIEMVDQLTRITTRMAADLRVLKAWHERWSGLRPPVDDAAGLQRWVSDIEHRIDDLEQHHREENG